MDRRHFIKAVGATGAAMALSSVAKSSQFHSDTDNARVSQYLRSLMPSRKQVDNFVRGRQGPEQLSRNQGWVFDSELGWILCDSIRPRSVDGSKGFYTYETNGARKVVNFSERSCRIHTYGNSFTHCDQVSDGETWQEYLAAHLQEPIRNYGVGGYSVYQAFRRMLKVERTTPVKYIILNIWDDDHFRNLDSWRAIRFGHRTPCGYTLPYLRVNVQEDKCEQIENLCRESEDVYKLCDEDYVRRTFREDPVLNVALCTRSGDKATRKLLMSISNSFGITDEKILILRSEEAIRKIHTEAALYATKNIVTWTEQFIEKTGKKLMLILSFGQGNIARELQCKPRFDQSFVEWLKGKSYPVVDMRDYFREDNTQFKIDVNTYLKRYYIGHHNPAGNFFTAWALKNHLVQWLDPRPAPYQ
jgi:hypothetical protein